MFGLALVPTVAGIVVTSAFLLGIQAWPMHDPVELALLIMSASTVVLAVVVAMALVRHFLTPFEEIADSRARYQELYQEAREDALNDALTGLGNHRAFQEELRRQVSLYHASGEPFSLVLMDLDDLKRVNDSEGHQAGDDLLKGTARTMRELARREDLLYRIGGDEFALILPGTSIDGAQAIAQRMLHFSRRPSVARDRPGQFSCGISGVPWFSVDKDQLYRQADAALYWAKRHGRGSVEVFEPERDALPETEGDLNGHAVLEVMTGGLLKPVYQPIVDLRSGRVIGFEGLIRPDPNGPLPDTGRLFAAAAAAGRTVELDLACLKAVIGGARSIPTHQLLTLNLSPRTLETKDFDVAWLLEGLMLNGISPNRVIVELTERDTIDDLKRLQQTFSHLQDYGLRLAADDVGAGNAGLRLLSQVQFDIVKIDLSLVQDGVRRMASRAVLRSLRDLALSQDAHVVAEGVETVEQLHVVRELDIGAGQGYLLGRPGISTSSEHVDLMNLSDHQDMSAFELPGATRGGLVVAWPEADLHVEQRPRLTAPFLARPWDVEVRSRPSTAA